MMAVVATMCIVTKRHEHVAVQWPPTSGGSSELRARAPQRGDEEVPQTGDICTSSEVFSISILPFD